jgi:peroxiredoxin
MQMVSQLRVGDEAPDFCLRATQSIDGRQEKREICLREYRGQQPVILTFYGAAFTPV